MKKTNYTFDNKELSYEIVEKGYNIYLDNKIWITQHEPYIPNRELSYEENALKQIEELVAAHEAAKKAQQEAAEAEQKAEQEKAELLKQVALQDEAINELANLVSELMIAQESGVQ